MYSFLCRHRSLFGYILIVLVAVIAIEVHHYQTNSDLEKSRDIACENAEVILTNQRVVLHTLLEQDLTLSARHEVIEALGRTPDEVCGTEIGE